MRSTTPTVTERWLSRILLAATLLIVFGQTPLYEALNNPNENVRVYMTHAIVKHGTFAIDAVIEEWGYANDKATYNGQMFAGKAPGSSFLAVPTYWLWYKVSLILGHSISKSEAVLVCRYGTSIPLLALFLGFWLGDSRRWAADFSARATGFVGLALGSTMLIYGAIFVSHALVAAAIFAAMMCFDREREGLPSARLLFAGGFLLAAAVALEYPGAIGGAVVGLLALYRSRRRLFLIQWSALGMVIPLGLTMLFHWRAFGSPMGNPYSHLESPEFIAHVSGGFFGLQRFSTEAFQGSFFAPNNGLFWFLPWSLIPVAGLAWGYHIPRLRWPAFTTLLVLVLHTIFIMLVNNWRGGWTAGPRYIVPLVPFLAWYMVHLLDELRVRAPQAPAGALALALVLVSQVNCGLAAATFPHFPESLINPIREVSLFFLQQGYDVRGMGTLAGLKGSATWVPLALAHLVAFGVAASSAVILKHRRLPEARTLGRLAARSAVILVVAASFLSLQARPSTPDPEFLSLVRRELGRHWMMEPMLPCPELPPADERLHLGAAELQTLARAMAACGNNAVAISLHEAARRPR